jgi:hypothetical protein
MVAHICNPRYSRGRARRTMIWGWPEQKDKTLFEKQTKGKRAGGIIQVVEWLPGKHETLEFNSGNTKEKKKR